MSKERERWLRGELPGLVAEGVIDETAAERLRVRYPGGSEGDYRKTLFAVFAGIGTSLIFLGAIVLMAFNWERLPRAARVVSAFLPLLAAQAAAVFTFLKKNDRASWREASSLAVMFGLAACAGLLGQIYHLPGGAEDLILAVAVLSLPFIYVLRSNAGTLLYLIAVTAWAAMRQFDDGDALLYWPLFAAILPRLALSLRADRYGGASAYLGWISAISICVGMGISLEKTLPGLWIVAYAGLFACMKLAGSLWFDDAPRSGADPFGSAGFLGAYALAFLLTYAWPWHEIGWSHMRDGSGYHAIAGIADYLVSGGLVAAFASLTALAVVKRKFAALPEAVLALACLSGYVLMSSSGGNARVDLAIHLVLNACILGAGVFHVFRGYRAGKIGEINTGTLAICVLICLRFIFVEGFFEHMIVRGLIFIGLGAIFLVGNFALSKRLGKGAAK